MSDHRAIKAGLLYCAVVFLAGLALGAVRSFWVVPLSGELVAVILEAPVILAVAWSACGWVAKRLELSENLLDRLMMGAVALAALVLGEAAIAIAAGGQALDRFTLRGGGQSSLLIGLLAQLAFALFPVLRRRNAGG
jgi:hypothetical protein